MIFIIEIQLSNYPTTELQGKLTAALNSCNIVVAQHTGQIYFLWLGWEGVAGSTSYGPYGVGPFSTGLHQLFGTTMESHNGRAASQTCHMDSVTDFDESWLMCSCHLPRKKIKENLFQTWWSIPHETTPQNMIWVKKNINSYKNLQNRMGHIVSLVT